MPVKRPAPLLVSGWGANEGLACLEFRPPLFFAVGAPCSRVGTDDPILPVAPGKHAARPLLPPANSPEADDRLPVG
jgi:hypothetical protein